MKTFKETLIEMDACEEAVIWIGDKDFKNFYETCERGDWLLWLYARTNKDDLMGLTLAKGHCANTVRHLMNDKRSTDAIDVAILFGEGKATLEQLNAASFAANAPNASDSFASSSAASAANAAANASASFAANAASAYYAAAATYAASSAANTAAQNQQLTADICRKYLPIENFNINY